MKKITVIALGLLILFGCNNNNITGNTPNTSSETLSIPDISFTNDNQSIFAVKKNNVTTQFTWDSGTTNVGFVDLGTSFGINFKDETSDGSTGFKDYFFVQVSGNSEGKYTGNNNLDSLIYYDSQGNSYSSFFSYKDTNVNIVITKWSDSEITGTFTGKLWCNELSEYALVAGKFISFDSTN